MSGKYKKTRDSAQQRPNPLGYSQQSPAAASASPSEARTVQEAGTVFERVRNHPRTSHTHPTVRIRRTGDPYFDMHFAMEWVAACGLAQSRVKDCRVSFTSDISSPLCFLPSRARAAAKHQLGDSARGVRRGGQHGDERGRVGANAVARGRHAAPDARALRWYGSAQLSLAQCGMTLAGVMWEARPF